MTEERFYRKYMISDDLIYFRVVVKQTDMYIGAKKNLSLICRDIISGIRNELDEYIEKNPSFASSLYPIKQNGDECDTARLMKAAAQKAGIGPMAGVAGAFNAALAKKILPHSDELIIENGGDILICSKKERRVSLYSGENSLKGKLHIKIKAEDMPMGICTSSGKFGHSFSMGKADAVCILSPDAILSDAMATATANLINAPCDIARAIDFAMSVENVTGVIAVCDGKIGAAGNVEFTD